GEHGLMFDHQALADIQVSKSFGQLPAKDNVLILVTIRFATSQDSFRGQKSWQEHGRGFDVDAFALQFVGNSSEEGIILLAAESIEERDRSPVRANTGVDSGLVDGSGHRCARDPRLLENAAEFAQL